MSGRVADAIGPAPQPVSQYLQEEIYLIDIFFETQARSRSQLRRVTRP